MSASEEKEVLSTELGDTSSSSSLHSTSPSLLWFDDSHCHISHENVPNTCSNEKLQRPVQNPHNSSWHLRSMVFCGTHPCRDWAAVAQCWTQSSTTTMGTTSADLTVAATGASRGPEQPSSTPLCWRAGFGVHPWFLEPTLEANLPHLTQLEAHLRRYPEALVAEIGLDALKGPPLEAVQVPLFIAQLRLAAWYGRPVSVHCVRAYPVLQRLFSGGALWSPQVSASIEEALRTCSGNSRAPPPDDAEIASATAHTDPIPSGPTPKEWMAPVTTDAALQETNGREAEHHTPVERARLLLAPHSLLPADIPPAIVLHGFSGSHEIAKALLHLKALKCPSVPPGRRRRSVPADRPPACNNEMQTDITALSSSGTSGAHPVKLAAAPLPLSRLCVSDRLYFGLGARTSLRLKGFAITLLPLLWSTGRVLVESDAFYVCHPSPDSSSATTLSLGIRNSRFPVLPSTEDAIGMQDLLRAFEEHVQQQLTSRPQEKERGAVTSPLHQNDRRTTGNTGEEQRVLRRPTARQPQPQDPLEGIAPRRVSDAMPETVAKQHVQRYLQQAFQRAFFASSVTSPASIG